MRKIIIAIIAVLVVLAGVWFSRGAVRSADRGEASIYAAFGRQIKKLIPSAGKSMEERSTTPDKKQKNPG